jgi:putative serine protease PepD
MILAVRGHKIGETVEITYMRGEEELSSQITFGDDAELQKLQQEQLQQQQQQQENGYGIESPYDERRDYGEDVTYEEILDYLFNR